MARSHHRKKHKSHVQQYKQNRQAAGEKAKSTGTRAFLVTGAVLGFAIGYIATSGAITGMIIGLLLGAAAGYMGGKKIDRTG